MSKIKNKKLHRFISIAVAGAIATAILTSIIIPGPVNGMIVFGIIVLKPVCFAVIVAITLRLIYWKSGRGKFGTYYGYTISIVIFVNCIATLIIAITAPQQIIKIIRGPEFDWESAK